MEFEYYILRTAKNSFDVLIFMLWEEIRHEGKL
jgi:hypothetical protein